MFSVVRAGCGFRMILNRDDRQRRVPHALDTLVIQVDMRHFDFGRQAVGLHGKAVIVRGDLDVAVAKIFDRLIAAAMAKHELESLAAKRAPQQLMAKADAKRRHA